MNKNAFDLGYEIVWIGHCRGHIRKIPDLPIVEFYKAKYENQFDGKKIFYWNVRPLVIKDDKIDEALPRDWRNKTTMGFKKFRDLEEWIKS